MFLTKSAFHALTFCQLLAHPFEQTLIGFFGNHLLHLRTNICHEADTIEEHIIEQPMTTSLVELVLNCDLSLFRMTYRGFDNRIGSSNMFAYELNLEVSEE